MRRYLFPLIVLVSLMHAPTAESQEWRREENRGVDQAYIKLKDGTFVGLFCAPRQVPKLSFVVVKPGKLHNPIPYDEKAMEFRLLVDNQRHDLPAKAEDGELYAEIKDYNLELRFDAAIEALRNAETAILSIPVKRWKVDLALDGANQALDGIMAKCR